MFEVKALLPGSQPSHHHGTHGEEHGTAPLAAKEA